MICAHEGPRWHTLHEDLMPDDHGGPEAVMLALGNGCKYRSSLAERFDCTETLINQLLVDSYQNPE